MNQNKKDKIQLLKDIIHGKVTLKDLKPKELLIKIGPGGHKYFINRIEVSEEIYEREALKQPEMKFPCYPEIYIGGVLVSDE